jgi:hypothetical protein
VKEQIIEPYVQQFYESQGYKVSDDADVDFRISRWNKVHAIVEIKGDQINQSGSRKGAPNDAALRQSFFTGLGQLIVARGRFPSAKANLVLTPMYEEIVAKYADALKREKITIIFIHEWGLKHVKLGKYRHSFRITGRGHPDGSYRYGPAVYSVMGGKLARVKWEGKLLEGVTFASLCRRLELQVRRDSAARVLYRFSYLAKRAPSEGNCTASKSE